MTPAEVAAIRAHAETAPADDVAMAWEVIALCDAVEAAVRQRNKATDYARELEAERDRLAARVAEMEAAFTDIFGDMPAENVAESVGRVMRAVRGRANPQYVRTLVLRRADPRPPEDDRGDR